MDTIAACGDVNRNVLATSAPGLCSEETYEKIQSIARELSEFVMPHTTAYHEIFLDLAGNWIWRLCLVVAPVCVLMPGGEGITPLWQYGLLVLLI